MGYLLLSQSKGSFILPTTPCFCNYLSLKRTEHENSQISQYAASYYPKKTYMDNLFHTLVTLSQVALHFNAVEYKILGIMQQRLYECCLNNVDELKQRLHWLRFAQRVTYKRFILVYKAQLKNRTQLRASLSV